MNLLSFLLARTLRREATLAALSVGQNALLADLEGRRVALVGNARSLASGHSGKKIDAADLVVRINRAPIPDPESHGTRTDWLALAVRPGRTDIDRLGPGRLLWMSHKRKRLPWDVAATPGFYLHPLADWAALRDELRAPPTTGLMMIALLARSRLATLDLYGFDFFASLSLTGSRSAAQVPHDFAAEKAWVDALMMQDTRIRMAGV